MINSTLANLWDSRSHMIAFAFGVSLGLLRGCPAEPIDTAAVVEELVTEEDILASEPEPELIPIPVVAPTTL